MTLNWRREAVEKIEEVDLRDGKKDGKMPKIKDAAHCMRIA